MRKPKQQKQFFHVKIGESGDYARKLDIIAGVKKISRCDAIATLIESEYERLLEGEQELDPVS
jgi:hypothetical protein